MYALEKLFQTSGRAGTDLKNFAQLLGGGPELEQTVQRYQYAAMQVGVSNEEVKGSFVGLQKVMTTMALGKGAPEGLARLANVVKMQVGELRRLAKEATEGHPEGFQQVLQKYAGLETNAGLRNKVLSDFGQSGGMIAALSRQAFTPEKLAAAPQSNLYTNAQNDALDKSRAKWETLIDKIEHVVGKLNARFGAGLAQDFDKLVTHIEPVVTKLADIVTKFHLLEKLGTVFDGWGEIFDSISATIDKINELSDSAKPPTTEEGKKEAERRADLTPDQRIAEDIANEKSATKGIGAGIAGFFREFMDAMRNAGFHTGKDIPPGTKGAPPQPRSPSAAHDLHLMNERYGRLPPGLPNVDVPVVDIRKLLTPLAPVTSSAAAQKPNQTISVQQDLHFSGAPPNPQTAAEVHRKAVRQAWNQAAAAQGN